MPCYLPLEAFRAPGGKITFSKSQALGSFLKLQLPCGRCLGCRLEKAKEWALRCSHEASLYNDSKNCSFITLTYDDQHLPEHGNLNRSHFQKFIRALRKKTGDKIRYFMCGEYGTKSNRPHYHAILFGFTFKDKKLVNIRNGNRVFTSGLLDRTWKHGACEIGSVTFESAGYVARYLLKKQQSNPDEIFTRYVLIDADGVMTSRPNEYVNMSLKPGIGYDWYKKNKSDLFPHDFAVMPNGRETAVPYYYRRLLEKDDPAMFAEIQKTRVENARSNPDNSPSRLAVRENVVAQRIKRLQRNL